MLYKKSNLQQSEGVPKKPKTDEGDDKEIKEDTKPNTKEGMLKRKIRKRSSQVLFWIRIKV